MNARSKLDQLLVDISDIQGQGQTRGASRTENLRPVLVAAQVATETVAEIPESMVEDLISTQPELQVAEQETNQNQGSAAAPTHTAIRMHLNEQVRFQLVMNETEQVVEILPLKEHVVLQFPDGKSLRIPRV